MREVSQLRRFQTAPAVIALGVCLASLASAQFPGVGSQASPDSAAKVASLTGQVSVLKGSEPWALNTGDLVYPKQVVISGSDGFAIFQVSDGTTFEIYPNSRVTFRSNPGSLSDLIDLWLGRVKVHVQRWGGQPNPNRIHTPTAVISVRGTTFDVALEGAESDTTWVAVEEGSVGVRHRLIPRSDEQVLNAGDELRVYRNAPLAKSKIDKGAIAKETMNTLADVFYRVMAQRGGFGGGAGSPTGGGGSPPLPGDTGAQAPSAPPPPLPGDTGASAPPPPPAPAP